MNTVLEGVIIHPCPVPSEAQYDIERTRVTQGIEARSYRVVNFGNPALTSSFRVVNFGHPALTSSYRVVNFGHPALTSSYRAVNFGHPALTSSFTKYKFSQMKNSFATIVYDCHKGLAALSSDYNFTLSSLYSKYQ